MLMNHELLGEQYSIINKHVICDCQQNTSNNNIVKEQVLVLIRTGREDFTPKGTKVITRPK